jgi:hypothetical protein
MNRTTSAALLLLAMAFTGGCARRPVRLVNPHCDTNPDTQVTICIGPVKGNATDKGK